MWKTANSTWLGLYLTTESMILPAWPCAQDISNKFGDPSPKWACYPQRTLGRAWNRCWVRGRPVSSLLRRKNTQRICIGRNAATLTPTRDTAWILSCPFLLPHHDTASGPFHSRSQVVSHSLSYTTFIFSPIFRKHWPTFVLIISLSYYWLDLLILFLLLDLQGSLSFWLLLFY